MSTQCDDGSYDVASFLCGTTYRVRILVRILSNTLLTVRAYCIWELAKIWLTKTLYLTYRDSTTSIKFPPLCTSICEVDSLENIVLPFILTGYSGLCTRFGVEHIITGLPTWKVLESAVSLNYSNLSKKSSLGIRDQWQFFCTRKKVYILLTATWIIHINTILITNTMV